MDTVDLTFKLWAEGTLKKLFDLVDPRLNAPIAKKVTQTYTYGTAAGKIDLSWLKRYEFTGAEDSGVVDLKALEDQFGDVVNFASVRAILIENEGDGALTVTTDSGDVAMTNHWVNAPWGDSDLVIPAGASVLFVANDDGWDTAADNKELVFESAATLNVNVMILGVSA